MKKKLSSGRQCRGDCESGGWRAHFWVIGRKRKSFPLRAQGPDIGIQGPDDDDGGLGAGSANIYIYR